MFCHPYDRRGVVHFSPVWGNKRTHGSGRPLGSDAVNVTVLCVHAGQPPVGVAVFLRSQKLTISRLGADTGQNRHCAVEKFIVQPGANTRQILRAVDHDGLLRGRGEHVCE
jgi:hypothetical protein